MSRLWRERQVVAAIGSLLPEMNVFIDEAMNNQQPILSLVKCRGENWWESERER